LDEIESIFEDSLLWGMGSSHEAYQENINNNRAINPQWDAKYLGGL